MNAARIIAVLSLALLLAGTRSRAAEGPFERWLGSYSILSCRCTDNGKLAPLDCHLGRLSVEGKPGEELALRENKGEAVPVRSYEAPKGVPNRSVQWIEETEATSGIHQETVINGDNGFVQERSYELTRAADVLVYRRWMRVKTAKSERVWECVYRIERSVP